MVKVPPVPPREPPEEASPSRGEALWADRLSFSTPKACVSAIETVVDAFRQRLVDDKAVRVVVEAARAGAAIGQMGEKGKEKAPGASERPPLDPDRASLGPFDAFPGTM
jgi:hypothetical protein